MKMILVSLLVLVGGIASAQTPDVLRKWKDEQAGDIQNLNKNQLLIFLKENGLCQADSCANKVSGGFFTIEDMGGGRFKGEIYAVLVSGRVGSYISVKLNLENKAADEDSIINLRDMTHEGHTHHHGGGVPSLAVQTDLDDPRFVVITFKGASQFEHTAIGRVQLRPRAID